MPCIRALVLCATPRSGSTLLCETLRATGVAGRPHSYLRPVDIAYWAQSWGLPPEAGTDDGEFDRRYLDAMLRHGRAGTDVFALRLMWDSVEEATRRLRRATGREADLPALIEGCTGPALYVHLSRADKVAQAVSRVRAEQSGVWHLAADGSVLEADAPAGPAAYDPARIAQLVQTLRAEDDAWTAFFRAMGIAPLSLTYEAVTAEVPAAIARILSALGLDPDLARRTPVQTSKIGDALGREWIERFRQDHPEPTGSGPAP